MTPSAVAELERLLGRGRVHSLEDAERLTGLSADFLRQNQLALGLPLPEPDEPIYEDDHVENLRLIAGLLEAGFSSEDLLQMGRVMGHSLRRVAETFIDSVSASLVRPGDSEEEVAHRYAEFADAMLPQLDRMVGAVLRLHLHDAVRQDAAVQVERSGARLTGAREVAVAFADLAGFTALGDQAELEQVGAVAGRFEALAAQATAPPTRLVKVLGDGALYVSRDPAALLRTVLGLMAAAAERGLPAVHAGAAHGPAVRSTGDWYGHTVNLASRLCGAARPGTALVSAGLVEAAGAHDLAAPHGQPLRLRGVEEAVSAFVLEPRAT